jgi:NAD(P)-dependent dehydrogenase (short-subunit alcohol dehydrogenase family)
MTITMTEMKPAATTSLKGKVPLSTGSTSGIGLGIARAIAGAGSAIVINGFGKPEEIAATQLVEAQIEGRAKAHGIPREQVIRHVLLAQQPNKRFATVEELSAFTLFLTSDAAASITGTYIAVDGGWTAH